MGAATLKRPWQLRDAELTDERDWWNRRALVKALGLGTVGLASGCGVGGDPLPSAYALSIPPVQRSRVYTLDRPVTEERLAASHNNFIELGPHKDVWRQAGLIKPEPWSVSVGGLVSKPRTFGLEDLVAHMPLEERTYRFRCVEAWSMAVPWLGFPLRALLDEVGVLGSAKFVRFVTADEPSWFPGQAELPDARWPYAEGLRIDEAMHDLTILAMGIYGHALPNQHGAPIRLVVPWKYGFKSIKSVTRMELVEAPPPTFWNTLAPTEYSFEANVSPDLAHPRWSQKTERLLPGGDRIPTLAYNGYGELVAELYS